MQSGIYSHNWKFIHNLKYSIEKQKLCPFDRCICMIIFITSNLINFSIVCLIYYRLRNTNGSRYTFSRMNALLVSTFHPFEFLSNGSFDCTWMWMRISFYLFMNGCIQSEIKSNEPMDIYVKWWKQNAKSLLKHMLYGITLIYARHLSTSHSSPAIQLRYIVDYAYHYIKNQHAILFYEVHENEKWK